MQKIKLLPQKIVNQIAAGEVVERPFSVVKELIENSIDAGATEVTLRLVDGGKNYIAVEDNGSGMDRESLEMCILSHATSKLSSENLFEVHTFGFRGEALPSIASVSRISITTCDNDGNEAWQLQMEGHETPKITPSTRSRGTTTEVRDLFFATPARLKFLKSESYESEKCRIMFDELALSYPAVSFRFVESEKEKAFYASTDDLKKRIDDIFGEVFSKNTFEIKSERNGLGVRGYIGLPTFNKSAASHQYFFVNNRLVKDKIFAAALRSAYAGLIPHGRYPVAILQLTVPYGEVDVNVHPAKTEVRFRDADRIRLFLIGELKRAISERSNRVSAEMTDRFYASIATAIDTGKEGHTGEEATNVEMSDTLNKLNEQKNIKPSEQNNIFNADSELTAVNSTPRNFQNTLSGSYQRSYETSKWIPELRKRNISGLQKTIPDHEILPFPGKIPPSPSAVSESMPIYEAVQGSGPKLPEYKKKVGLRTEDEAQPSGDQMPDEQQSQLISLGNALFQLNNTYIIAENDDGLVIVDQHAAAERMLLEELKNKVKLSSQNLLIPETLKLTSAKIELLKSYNDLLTKLGVFLEYPSSDSVTVSAIPAILETSDAEPLLMDIVDELSAFGDAYTLDYKIHIILSTISCHSSLRAGRKLSVQEMNFLLRRMEDSPNVAQCCHGRPSYITLTIKDLNIFFERA